jgi:diadenosine tetraphosphatase ApaH/serine/threonine PP2A family protein phosphatase
VVDAIEASTPEADVRQMMGGVEADIILCAHTHDPLDRQVGGMRLINPGAVGYPQGEKSSARYALLTWYGGAWHVTFRLVRYDVEDVIQRLLAMERPYRLWIAERLRHTAPIPRETLE